MKINEVIQVTEIDRLRTSDFTGGKDSLHTNRSGKQIRKLPGSSGLMYSTDGNRYGGIDIKLWDPNGKDYLAQKNQAVEPKPVRARGEDKRSYEYRLYQWQRSQQKIDLPGQLIGKLSLEMAENFPLKGAVQVGTITVDEDYRGIGIAKAMYGIVLTILKRPLLAGSSQTPGGRRNWVSLANIPGVEMKGYFAMAIQDLTTKQNPGNSWDLRQNTNAEAAIDTIMGKLGGQYLGKSPRGSEYFAFDVLPNTTGKELEAHIKQKLVNVYGDNNSSAFANGLYAVWTGA